MAKKSSTKTTERAALAKQKQDSAKTKAMTKLATAAMAKVERFQKNLKEQNSTTRTVTVDGGSAVIAHTFDQLFQWGARALGEYSMRTAGTDGFFAKHIGLVASVPQTTVGFLVYVMELATRGKSTDMKMSLGREIAHSASNLLANLGLANSIRAIRYYLAQSIDEDQETQKEHAALLNKIADLTKQLEQKKDAK